MLPTDFTRLSTIFALVQPTLFTQQASAAAFEKRYREKKIIKKIKKQGDVYQQPAAQTRFISCSRSLIFISNIGSAHQNKPLSKKLYRRGQRLNNQGINFWQMHILQFTGPITTENGLTPVLMESICLSQERLPPLSLFFSFTHEKNTASRQSSQTLMMKER